MYIYKYIYIFYVFGVTIVYILWEGGEAGGAFMDILGK